MKRRRCRPGNDVGVYALLGVGNLYRGLFYKSEIDIFFVLIGAVWLLYASLWLVRAARGSKNDKNDHKTRV